MHRFTDICLYFIEQLRTPEIVKGITGTYEYLAPEVATWNLETRHLPLEERSLSPWSSRSDRWSIGCSLFELVADRKLFYFNADKLDKMLAIARLHRDFALIFAQRLPTIRDIDNYPFFKSILEGLLQIDPNQRMPLQP